MSGAVGILVPFSSSEDSDFFQTLEMHMRQEATFLTGRDHLSFRGYYYPQKAVIDGDLCETFRLVFYSIVHQIVHLDWKWPV